MKKVNCFLGMLLFCISVCAQKAFEGKIVTENYEAYSGILRKGAEAFNGVRDLVTYFKGTKFVQYDSSLRKRMLGDSNDKYAYFIYDATKKVVRVPIELISVYGEASLYKPTVTYHLSDTMVVSHRDNPCKILFCDSKLSINKGLSFGIEAKVRLELVAPPSFGLAYFYGVEKVQYMFDSYVVKLVAGVLLAKSASLYLNAKVKEIEEYVPEDKLFEIPADYDLVKISSATSPIELLQFVKAQNGNEKELEKHGISPKTDPDRTLVYWLDNEWNY